MTKHNFVSIKEYLNFVIMKPLGCSRPHSLALGNYNNIFYD